MSTTKYSDFFLRFSFASILAVTFILGSCGAPNEEAKKASVEGNVFNSETNDPIEGVEVTSSPSSTTVSTNSNGEFTIESIEPGDYQFHADKQGYEKKTNAVNVPSGKLVNVDFLLSSKPSELQVESNPLEFGTNKTTLSFSIENSGYGNLEWSISENAEWITVEPTEGSIGSDTQNKSKKTVVSSNDTTDMQNENYPKKNLNKSSVQDDSTDTPHLELQLPNQNASKQRTKKLKSSSVTVTVDRNEMQPGTYNETLAISSNGGNANIEVTMEVEGPELYVSKQTLSFGSTTNSLSANIKNNGVGSLDYNLVNNTDWLTITPTSGTVTTETDVITFTVNREGKSPGNYASVVTVNAGEFSHEIDVSMSIQDPNEPQLSTSEPSLTFGESEISKDLVVINTGTGSLNWQATTSSEWLGATPSSGSVDDQEALSVEVDRSGLNSGDFEATLSLTSNGGNLSIPVTMTVSTEPILSVEPTTLKIESQEQTGNISITNSGSGNLNWTASTSQSWINLDPLNGENDATINVNVDRQDLSPGDYEGKINIASDGGSENVEVIMTVPEDTPPEAITLQDPSDVTTSSLTIKWSRSTATDFSLYEIYRSKDSNVTTSSTKIETIGTLTETEYSDSNLDTSTTYYYRVYVVDEAGNKTGSNIVQAKTNTETGTWSSMLQTGTTLNTVDVYQSDYVYAGGDDGILYFYNGTEWIEENPSSIKYDISDIKIFGRNDIWIVYETGKIFHFDGTDWTEIAEINDGITNHSLGGATSDTVWVGSDDGYLYKIINKSTAQQIETSGSGYIKEFEFNGNNEGWFITDEGDLFTYNGLGWSPVTQTLEPRFVGYDRRASLLVFNSNNIWTGSTNFETPKGESLDWAKWNGSNWVHYDKSTTVNGMAKDPTANNAFWSAGDDIYYYNGSTFQKVTSPTDNTLYDIDFTDDGTGFAVGQDGVILIYS